MKSEYPALGLALSFPLKIFDATKTRRRTMRMGKAALFRKRFRTCPYDGRRYERG